MPYKSLKQERFFHTKTAKKKGITSKVVKEFDTASKGLKLPTKVSKKPKSKGFNEKKYSAMHKKVFNL
jgi:hypothetical protein